VVISGHVKIGPYSFLGVNATISDGITIAPECVIGAGATVVRDTKAKGVYIGEAAKLYMKDSSESKYFINTEYAKKKKGGE
jgi:acetyltransferase-like isoleucine patch superfamily enzyme